MGGQARTDRRSVGRSGGRTRRRIRCGRNHHNPAGPRAPRLFVKVDCGRSVVPLNCSSFQSQKVVTSPARKLRQKHTAFVCMLAWIRARGSKAQSVYGPSPFPLRDKASTWIEDPPLFSAGAGGLVVWKRRAIVRRALVRYWVGRYQAIRFALSKRQFRKSRCHRFRVRGRTSETVKRRSASSKTSILSAFVSPPPSPWTHLPISCHPKPSQPTTTPSIEKRQGAEYGTTKSCMQGGGEIITIAGEAFGAAGAQVHLAPHQQEGSGVNLFDSRHRSILVLCPPFSFIILSTSVYRNHASDGTSVRSF